MIYLKNNTETQAIYIPRQTVLGSGYIATTEKYEEGYNDGFEDGKKQQKDKLSSLHVAENGQYEREDGWDVVTVDVPDLNGSYNEGYEQGQADIAAKARVLEVTENGNYLSKYSDPIMPIVTGVYADDTKFYGYAELNRKVFNTKIAGSIDSRLEFWYKGDNTVSRPAGYNIIIGAGDKNNRANCFQIRYYAEENSTLWVEIGNSAIKVYNLDDTVWHHLIVSRAEGLWIDGKKRGDFSPTTNTINGEFYINGAGYDKFGNRPANGYFGMIKIDDVVIIPTANGFKNVNTDELLQVVKDGSYTFAENAITYGEGELYKTVNVDIDVDSYYNNGYNQGKTDGIREQRLKLESINITENGIYDKEDGYNHIEVNVPDLNGSYDEGKTDGINEQKSKLERIEITENGTYSREDGYNEVVVNVPDLNGDYNEGYNQGKADVVANASDIEVTKNGQYGDGKTLYKTINVNVVPKVNIQKAGIKFSHSTFTEVAEWADFEGIAGDLSDMFSFCGNLQTIPLIDTSNVTDMNNMFYGCYKLQAIPQLDTSNVTNMRSMFEACRSLQTIPLLNTSNVTNMASMFSSCEKLQTIPPIDTSNVTTMYYMFYYIDGIKTLVSLPKFNCQKVTNMDTYFSYRADGMSALTDVGGWENLKCNWDDNYGLKNCPNLTYQSCINVLNGLYDFTGNGETPNRNQGKLKVHQNFLDKVGDEISIGTNKGWTITA